MNENYFALMGVDENFDIDITQLKANNLRLKTTFHPDRFVNDTGSQKLAAANMIAEIHHAFDTLKSPYKRGEYLLTLAGVGKKDDSLTVKSSHLLIEQMELREKLNEIRQKDQPLSELTKFSADVDQLVSTQQRLISELFNQSDLLDDLTKTELVLISDALIKLRFLNKLQQEVVRFEEQLDDY